ncbi:MAG: FG-GAP-like repeat-containing protein [Chthoniobacteraceae bacterium]
MHTPIHPCKSNVARGHQTRFLKRPNTCVEALEGRIAPAAILFIDYGDLFPGGTLATTQGGFRDVADSAVPGDKILGTTLDSAVAFNAATPLNVVAQSFTADERAQMLDIVTRAYLPLDVEIVELTANAKTTSDGRTVRAATSMADVTATLRAGDPASKDAYVFVATFVVAPGSPNQVIYGNNGGGNSPSSPTLGVSSDLAAASNAHDDVAVVFSNGGFSNNTVNNISHEAGHNLGLRHSITNPTATPAISLFHQAEIMSYDNTNSNTSSIAFTRYPMIRGDGNTPTSGADPLNYNDLAARNGQVTLFDQMRLDANVGANPDFSFVSGTGAHDIITITKSGTFANVSVQAFGDAAYSQPITVPGVGGTTYSYSFPLTNSILIYAGGSNDRIVLDGDLGVNIQIDGMLGNDSIFLNGNGAANALYTPGSNSPDGVDRVTGNLVDTFGGTLSLGGTTISFENFETAGSITLQTIDTVSYVTPLAGADALVLSLNGVNPQVAGAVNDGTGLIPLILQNVGRLSIATGSANDTLTVDSTGGLLTFANGIDYDGGAGFNSLTLTQTGGAAQTSHTFSVGPNAGDVRSVIVGPGGTQSIFAQNLAPVVDLVPAALLTVNGTSAANQISYTQGTAATNGLVAVDEFETIEFSNKTNLVINAAGGSDTISLNNPNAPTGLTSITVNGGDPTDGDSLIITGTSMTDTVTFTPASFRSGSLTGLAAPITFNAIENVKFFGGDAAGLNTITIEGTVVGETLTVDAGLAFEGNLRGFLTPDFDFFEAGRITFNGNGGFDAVNVFGSDGTDNVTTAATAVSVSTPNSLVIVTLGTSVELLDISTLAGDDSINLSTLPAPTVAIVRGGDGNDTIIGSPQADTLYGGAGNDVLVGGAGVDSQYGEDGNDIFGNPTLTPDGVADDAGNDFNFGGPGFDNFVWEPGDGADFNNGGEDGADIFRFFGNAGANVFTLRSGGTPTHFNALIGAVNIDNHGIEDVIVDGQGGADTFTVDDLFATEVVSLNLNLSASDGGALDFVTINARPANDSLVVSTPAAGAVRVAGLRYNVNLTNAEATDGLTINGNDGSDSINVVSGVAAIVGVTISGGTGDDVLSGDAATINGNDGNDTLIGSAINNVLDGGTGDDTFLGNGGTDAAGGGAGSSVGDTILLPGTAGIDALSLALDASGFLLATVNGLTTTYTNFIGGPIATSGIERIKADGLDGNDALTVDSTNGAIPIPVSFDGGASSDSLTLTGGTATSDIYTPGPNPGQGTSTIAIGGVTQTVNFTGLEPVLDLVAGPLTVNGTNAVNVINYGPGNIAANGLISVDGFETIEFSNKTILVLNGLAGSDTISINNPLTPLGLTNITIDGGAGDDSLILFGTPAADDFTFTGPTTTSGTLTLLGVAPVAYSTTEHALLVGLAGDDVFRVGSAAGRVQLIGGEGSDTVDFFDAVLSGVVFNLDLLHDDQPVNATGAIVSLGEVMENFVGTIFNDTILANLRAFPRFIDGRTPSALPGVPGSPVPPGDRLIVDALGQFAMVTKLDANTGTITSPSYALFSYDEIETLEVINSTGGGGFDNGKAFTAAASYKVGKTPTDVVTGDLNGDGFDDIVTANSRLKSVSVLLARGDGTFFPAVNFLTGGSRPVSLALANMDDNANIAGGDSDLDIVVTNLSSKTVGVLLNDGTGNFGTAVTFKTAQSPGVMRLADFNNDGLLDISALSKGSSKISVLLNTGGGVAGTTSFGAFTAFKAGRTQASDFVVGNFDGDALGNLDFALVLPKASSLAVFKGDGLGGFTLDPTRYKLGRNPGIIALADFNNDGIIDVAVNHTITRFVSVLLGRGNAGGDLFQPQIQTFFDRSIAGSETLLSGDFDADGDADIAFGSDNGASLRVALGTGNGLFHPIVRFSFATLPAGLILPRLGSGITTGDFNGDNALDIVQVNRLTSTINVIIRTPTA